MRTSPFGSFTVQLWVSEMQTILVLCTADSAMPRDRMNGSIGKEKNQIRRFFLAKKESQLILAIWSARSQLGSLGTSS